MDNEQTIDSFVDSLSVDPEVEGSSSPATEESSETVLAAPETVAPDQVAQTEVSSSDVVADAGTTSPSVEAPAPDPALIARLEAAETQAREASARAEQSERLIQQAQMEAQRRAYEQHQQRQNEEFQARALRIENINDPEIQKAEAARLVAEVQQARNAEAQQVIQLREQQSAQRLAALENDTHRASAIAAGFYQTIQTRSDLTDAQKQEILADTKYYAQYPNPKAQQEAIARDQNLVSTAVSRAKAEWEKAQGMATQAKVAGRTAADTDLVGSASGSAGNRTASIDDFVDSLGW